MENSLNSVVAQSESLIEFEVTSFDLVQNAMMRMNASQDFNAFVALNEDSVIEQAVASDARRKRGQALSPVDGIPIAVKDNYWTKDHPTTACSKVVPPIPLDQDATIVHKLREAGAIIFGKTNMHEWAYGATNTTSVIGPTKHPYNPDHITGGSSGGSAVAVANGVVAGALGSDTGGSVRIPSAACGLVGYKPSYGRASRHGILPLSWSLDAPGILARRVEDIELLAPYLLGQDAKDHSTFGAQHFDANNVSEYTKILSLTGDYLERREDVEAVFAASLNKLTVQFDYLATRVDNMKSYFSAWEAILHAEASSYHEQLFQDHPEGFSEVTQAHLAAGNELLATEYLSAQKIRHKFLQHMTGFFAVADLLVLPTLPVTAPRQADDEQIFANRRVTTQDSMTWFCWLANLAGLPSITLPAGNAENGFPVGLMMMGQPGADESLLRAAYNIQAILDTHCLTEPV